MTDKKCDGNCCDGFFNDYNEVEDDYDIQRLEDIIEICEFLIKVKKHRMQKKEAFDKIFEESVKEDKVGNSYKLTNTDIPLHIYKYKYPKRYIPYWDRVWF